MPQQHSKFSRYTAFHGKRWIKWKKNENQIRQLNRLFYEHPLMKLYRFCQSIEDFKWCADEHPVGSDFPIYHKNATKRDRFQSTIKTPPNATVTNIGTWHDWVFKHQGSEKKVASNWFRYHGVFHCVAVMIKHSRLCSTIIPSTTIDPNTLSAPQLNELNAIEKHFIQFTLNITDVERNDHFRDHSLDTSEMEIMFRTRTHIAHSPSAHNLNWMLRILDGALRGSCCCTCGHPPAAFELAIAHGYTYGALIYMCMITISGQNTVGHTVNSHSVANR